MNNKALKTLEYTKIIEMLAAHASSPLGKIRCEDLLPSCSPGEIEYKQEQTQDALSRLFQKGNINFGSAKDIRGSLKRLEIGSLNMFAREPGMAIPFGTEKQTP